VAAVKNTYRSSTGFVLGWVWLAFVAYNAYDLTVHFNGRPSLVAAAVLGVLTAVVYLTVLRPATTLAEDGLRVRNPLRNVFLPWTAIGEVTTSHAISVRYEGDPGGEQVVRLWAPQASARERAKAARRGAPQVRRGRIQTEPTLSKGEQAAAEALAGRTHADWVAQQITERAEAARRRSRDPGQVRQAWAADAVVVCVLALALLVAAVLA
jgi:hypothetical protein